MKSITVQELATMVDEHADYQLIDVREVEEYEQANIDGELIPLKTIPQSVEEIDRDRKVVVHCRSGKRSANAIAYLEQNHGFTNLYNLEGGIMAWRDQIDETLDID